MIRANPLKISSMGKREGNVGLIPSITSEVLLYYVLYETMSALQTTSIISFTS